MILFDVGSDDLNQPLLLPPALSFANDALSTFRIASFAVDSVADFSYFERIMGTPLCTCKLSTSTWLVSVQGTTRLKVKQPLLHCCHGRCYLNK